MQPHKKHIWLIIICLPIFIYSSDSVLRMEQETVKGWKGNYGPVNILCWGIAGASGMVIIMSFMELHRMAERLVKQPLNTFTEQEKGSEKECLRKSKGS